MEFARVLVYEEGGNNMSLDDMLKADVEVARSGHCGNNRTHTANTGCC